jgi:peptide/nickel transport system permease protein
MDISQGTAAPLLSAPTRLRLFLSALKYLAAKALTILVTIFVGVFITMLIVNYPPGIGTDPNKSPFEVRLESEIDWVVRNSLYSGSIIIPGPIEYETHYQFLTNKLRAEVGLDLPYWPRNLLWTFKALTFDWGELDSSFIQTLGMGAIADADAYGNAVLHYFPNTLLLVGTSYLLVFLLGMPLALYLARNYGSRLDRLVTVLSPISSVPSWVFAILLIALFAVQLRWLPVGGMTEIFFKPRTPIENILIVSKHMVLPVIALVLSLLFQLVYAWRTFFIIYSEEDYVELARAKGLDHKVLERQYILRPALPYIITSFTTSLIGFWQLTVALESIFQWPGIGLLYIEALPNYWGERIAIGDLMIVIQIVVIFAYLLGILVFILDVVYVLIDPRIHLISNNIPTRENALAKAKTASARLFSVLQRSEKSPRRARQVIGPRERRVFSPSETFGAARDSIRDAWARSGLFFRELRRYPSAVFGLTIILALLVGSLYAVLALPYEEFGRSYNEDRVSGFNLRPRVAAPTWFNFFSVTPRLSTLIMDENNAGVSTSNLDNGWTQKTVTFRFQYPYHEMPSDVFLYLDPTYIEKFPFVSLVWKTPDGRVLNLKPIAVGHSINFDFKEGVQVPKFLNQNPEWKDWFVESGQYATPAYQLLFAQPGAAQPKTQTGEYQLEISSIFFEDNSDLHPQLVLLGQVYGLAGTDFWRRDLVVPLFWGMPFVLFIGLLGTFITTLVALVLPAVGVWYGGWLDNLIQRLTEVNMVLPGLAIVVLTNLLFGVNVWIILGIIVLLNAFGSPIKSFRSAFLQAKEAPYIEMASSYGASDFRIITRYLVPRILPVFMPQLVTQVPSFIFLEATLGFFNINSHYPSWGRIIYDGLAHGAIYGSPFWVLEPMFLLLLTGLAFAMLGSALERILNPRIISDVSATSEKVITPRRKLKLPVLTRRVIVSVILALLAFAFLVPTIQGKTLASFFLNLMDETRKLNTTITRPSAIPSRTSMPVTSTSTEVPASATEPLATSTSLFPITPTTQASCIPANSRASARVLEIVDGNTVKVLMDGLVYVVRYIGVELPQDDVYTMDAYLVNSELVFRKDVTLIGDRMYRDPSGRLLRYILVEDTFINVELLQRGLGKAVDAPPNSSCSQIFKAAEESAIQSAQGVWAVPTLSP